MFENTKLGRHFGHLAQFSLWGFISFLLGLAVLYVLYDLLGMDYWLAVPLSVMTHLALHYAATRGFVFTKCERTFEVGFLIFVLIGIAEIVFITGGVTLIVEYLNGDVYWTRIGVGVIAAIGGFWANAKYNFKVL